MDWGSTLWGYTLWGSILWRFTLLGYRFRMWLCTYSLWASTLCGSRGLLSRATDFGSGSVPTRSGYLHSVGLHSGGLGVYSLRLPVSDLDLYLLALGVYTLGVYSLRLRISDLELYMRVRKKRIIEDPSSQACLGNNPQCIKP